MRSSKNRRYPLGFQTLCLGCSLLIALVADLAAQSPQGRLTQSTPEAIGLLSAQLEHIDAAAMTAIQAGEIPGAVILVGRRGQIAYLKAFGNRALKPKPEQMTVDTIFDLASLTKVVATTPSIMLLVENGALRLEDKVRRYLPKFTGGGKDAVTVRQLLTHYSGLAPDFDLSKSWEGYSAGLEELWKEKTRSEPGKEFAYSDLNFIALSEIVRVLSGKTLDVFSHQNIFQPLGMMETLFLPPQSLRPRIAPTESRGRTLSYLNGTVPAGTSDEILRGEVHDPTAWRMGGVAGHAGLFSTAQDLAIYAQMILNRGNWKGGRVLSPLAVQAMTSVASPPALLPLRGLGWDIDSGYSAPRGDLFKNGFGHSGFSGTSLWIHPPTETFVILLSNSVHPEGKGNAIHLRGVVANIVAAAISDAR
jgi:CubicO group peptidase (beta-lactamase class C family)